MRFLLPLVLGLPVAGCGTEAPVPSPGAGASSAGQPAQGGAGGGVTAPAAGGGGSGGVEAGGSSSPGGAGAGGGPSGGAGTGGSAGGSGGQTAGGGATAGAASESFQCSQLMGPNVAGEWFDAGFEAAVGSGAWQVKAPHHSFVEDWAAPEHDVWRESDCQGTYSNCETKSKCETGAPDRVLFVTQTGDYLNTPQAAWETSINAAIATIKAKYPDLERVELLTFVRSPEGQNCGSETTVSPNLDAAHEAIAAASNGFVKVGPHLTASSCDRFAGSPHMNQQGNAEIAEQLAEHYGEKE